MIIVTGGAGFIGSALIARLNARGINDIIVVDELGENEKWKNLRNLSFRDYVEKNMFVDSIITDELPEDIEAIFHMGACSDTTETDASYLANNNYLYTKMLAEWAIDMDVQFIYASSAATYGDGSEGFVDDESAIHKLRPLNIYGYSKQMFDLWAYQESLFQDIVGLKYFNVFGPNEYHKGEMRSFVIKAYEQITNTSKVRLFKSYKKEYKDGEQLRDFIYISDAVDMTLFFFDNPDINGLYNIGTGRARSWNDLVKAVFAALNKEPKIEYIDMPDSIKNQYQYFTQADITKIIKTGYTQPTTPLEEAVEEYVKDYLINNNYLSGH